MKLTYFKTHWTAADALVVKEFLEDIIAGIEASYADEFDDFFEDMRQECLKRNIENSHRTPDQGDLMPEIPF